MKRPMVCVGIAALTLSAAALYASQYFFLIFIIIALAAVIAIILLKGKGIITLIPLFSLVLLVCIRCGFEINKIEQARSLSGDITLSGVISEVDYYENSVGLTVECEEINGQEYPLKIYINSSGGYFCEPGDRITAMATLSDKAANYSYGTHATAYNCRVLSRVSDNNIYSLLHSIRTFIKETLFSNMRYDSATLTLGLTVGDKSYMSDELSDNIRRSGVSHIVVVSGMHLAIITGYLMRLARKNKSAGLFYAIAGIALVTFIVALTGFSASILRAAIVYYVIFISMLIGRTSDALNSLFTAAFIIVLINPFAVGNISFQLSASATYGVLCVAPVITEIVPKGEGIINRAMRSLASIVATALSALIMTSPFVFATFGSFSLVSVATNLFVAHAASAILSLAVFSLALSFIPAVCKALLTLADVCAGYMIAIINWLGSLPFAEIKFENKTLPAALAALVALSVAAYCFIKYDKIKRSEYLADNT